MHVCLFYCHMAVMQDADKVTVKITGEIYTGP
jgi:hypothetical protein